MALEEIELDERPVFELDQKVRVTKLIRNDGTFPGLATGTVLVEEGDVGYVCGIGTFLQKFYIYSVHFLTKNMIVGCRKHEIELVEES
ncbi:MAG: nitrogen fixation protein NifZ [Symploca sp. SIO2E9]|nr:nitrogen fixation protein NifZ [Symploca sp. SIO2E9]